MTRTKILVKGVVQGVGFRPFCARTAKRLDLNGYVKNTSAGVEVVLEGSKEAIEGFISELWENPPLAAVVSEVIFIDKITPSARAQFFDFTIAESRRDEKQQVFIPPDIALCPECLREMRDPANRRYRYPFINCTLCGPRYTIIEGLPYDRPKTTMSKFKMCPDCEAEYNDALDRRFHAQPNACPICGPQIEGSIEDIVSRLKRGQIVAIKGIGGFHIACTTDDKTVNELRRRKNRPAKPFAIMARDIRTAKKFLEISHEEQKLLESPQAPIALCRAIDVSRWSVIAPQQKSIGVMLPYTPIHHLIMEIFETLVMTSANLSEAPIISQNDEAEEGLLNAGIVDAILLHDRDIETAIDDSVMMNVYRRGVRVIRAATDGGGRRISHGGFHEPPENANPSPIRLFLRRARGFVPNPLKGIAKACPPILAAGADIKSAFAVSQDDTIFPSQYLGDLRQLKTAEYYRRALRHFTKLYSITPKILAHDAHPDYFSTKLGKEFAYEFGIEKIIPVQHHAAHFASALLENGVLNEPAIGVIFDGIGYGGDKNIWGGEFFIYDGLGNFERAASVFPCRMPGGDKATEEPWRYALAMLEASLGAEEAANFAAQNWPSIQAAKIDGVLRTLTGGIVSTSCGRLFDGVSAMLSVCLESSFEGQAAMALEGLICDAPNFGSSEALPFEISDGDFPIIDWRPAVREIIFGLRDGKSKAAIAGAFHSGFARAIADMCELLNKKCGISRVALSGGVWQNAALLAEAVQTLEEKNFVPILHNALSPNDENIAVGQIAIASSML